MTISLDDLAFLSSAAGERVLARLADEDLGDEQTLKLITSLRRELSLTQAAAALEQAILRKKAVRKFGDDASKLYFTRDALEQASDPLIRCYRSSMVRLNPYKRILDVGCSIGSDALSFASAVRYQQKYRITGIDIDPVRVEMARLNAQALNLKNAQFEIRDAREGIPEADYIFYDPARRNDDGKRIFDVERYEPPLSLVRNWHVTNIDIKLSPGVELAQLKPYPGTVAFISVEGELKEAVLMLSDLQPKLPMAILLRDVEGHAQTVWTDYWRRFRHPDEVAPISEPLGWLVEPDPALIRAGLVADAAIEFGGAQLDPEIAYITTDSKPETVWARAWKIIDWMPFNVKKLRAYLRERNVGTVTVKKRGTAVTPEDLIAKLKLNGNGSRTIVLTRCRGEHMMLVCEDLTIDWGG